MHDPHTVHLLLLIFCHDEHECERGHVSGEEHTTPGVFV
jgi:hypothetical protein